MKKAAKALVVSMLAWQVKRLRQKHQFQVVAVVGSIGKTSTKLAIAQVLGVAKRVRYQQGNYNDIVTVPLIFFGHSLPSLMNPLAWAGIFFKNERQIHSTYPYDIVVIELGTDGPGQIIQFKKYISADIVVLTAITPEHMENFTGLPAIAEEELSVSSFAKRMLINIDLAALEYTQAFSGGFLSYGIKNDASYRMTGIVFNQEVSNFTVEKDRQTLLTASHNSFSEPQMYSLTAATAVADLMGLSTEEIVEGYEKIQPVNGRMQRLKGIKNSSIIDDSYNASPDAARAALDTLFRIQAPQRIALLGNMNELGTFSTKAHTDLGAYCDAEHLNLLVTLGPDANKYTAEAAEKNRCKVIRTESPYEAGQVIAEAIQEGGLILIKGSQNKVFAEEAIKSLLADPADESKLVRQSASWLKIKKQQFSDKVTERK